MKCRLYYLIFSSNILNNHFITLYFIFYYNDLVSWLPLNKNTLPNMLMHTVVLYIPSNWRGHNFSFCDIYFNINDKNVAIEQKIITDVSSEKYLKRSKNSRKKNYIPQDKTKSLPSNVCYYIIVNRIYPNLYKITVCWVVRIYKNFFRFFFHNIFYLTFPLLVYGVLYTNIQKKTFLVLEKKNVYIRDFQRLI